MIRMYYRYNENDEIIEKSETEIEGDRVVTYFEDIDIELFRVIVGFIGEDGQMLRHTKFIRSAELVAQRINTLKTELKSQIDFLALMTDTTLE